MQKKTATILVVISAIINIFAAAFLFLDLQTMQAPDTTVTMEIVELNSKEAKIQTTIDISNPNSFEIIVRDLKIGTFAPNGDKISSLKIDGKNIPANKQKTFIETSLVNYDGHSPEKLVTKVSGVVGMRTGIIEKTLPMSVKIVSDIEKVFNTIVPPEILIRARFGEFNQKDVNISVEIEIDNPNTFEIKIKDIVIDIKNETSGIVGKLTLPEIVLSADSKTSVSGSGAINIEALNAKVLKTNISANLSGKIAGFEKTIELCVESEIIVPDLKTLLPSNAPTLAVIRGDYRVSLFGLKGEISLETHNPNNIEMMVKDIEILVYRIDRNTKRKVAEGEIEGGIIKANDVTIMKGNVVIPYRKLLIPPLGGKIIPDWLEVSITANVTLKGLDDYFWVGMVAYQDFHYLKKDKAYDSPKEVEWR